MHRERARSVDRSLEVIVSELIFCLLFIHCLVPILFWFLPLFSFLSCSSLISCPTCPLPMSSSETKLLLSSRRDSTITMQRMPTTAVHDSHARETRAGHAAKTHESKQAQTNKKSVREGRCAREARGREHGDFGAWRPWSHCRSSPVETDEDELLSREQYCRRGVKR